MPYTTQLFLLLLALSNLPLHQSQCNPGCEVCPPSTPSVCQQCSQGYYLDTADSVCYACSPNCVVCSDTNHCQECAEKYYVERDACEQTSPMLLYIIGAAVLVIFLFMIICLNCNKKRNDEYSANGSHSNKQKVRRPLSTHDENSKEHLNPKVAPQPRNTKIDEEDLAKLANEVQFNSIQGQNNISQPN